MSDVTPIRYSFRSSLRGALWTLELTDDGLQWQAGRRGGTVAYAHIAQIRLSYRPISMQRYRFRMDVTMSDRLMLRVVSTTSLALVNVERQDEAYRAFVTALHARVPAGISFHGGLPRPLYWIAIASLALVGVALAGLLIRALADGVWQGAAFMVAFAALFGWQIGGFVWRNRPIVYSPQNLPAHLLP